MIASVLPVLEELPDAGSIHNSAVKTVVAAFIRPLQVPIIA